MEANPGPKATIAPRMWRNRKIWNTLTPSRCAPVMPAAMLVRARRPPLHEVDQHVLPEVLGFRVERAPAVQLCDQPDEVRQGRRPLEHERVDCDPVLRAAHDLAEGLLDRASRRRVAELDLPVLEVRR